MKRYNPAYAEQLKRWIALCDVHHTPAEIQKIEADQARRIKGMK